MKRKTGRAAVSMELELLSGNNALCSYNGHQDYNGHFGHKSVIIVSKTANMLKLDERYPITYVECCGVLQLF